MGRNDVIKALECCVTQGVACRTCPLNHDNRGERCYAYLKQDALALIRELTVENERLKRGLRFTLDEEQVGEIISRCREMVELDIKEIQSDTVQQLLDQLKDMAQIRYNDVGVSFLTVDMADIERVVKKILEGV